MSFLGIDIGTSGCKAVVFSNDGGVLGSASREYSVHSPQDGWAELNSVEVGDACLDVIRELAKVSQADPIEALAVSSQGEAFTVLDSSGRVLTNAMVSSDLRAAELLREWAENFGAERLYEITGHTAHPLFTLFKLVWLQRSRPDIWNRAAKFFCFEDYLHFRLGVDPALGWPLAGRTLLFDVRNKCWSPEILSAIGVRDDQLARPMESGAMVGQIPPVVAESLGLPRGVKVVAGGHDQVCGALGAGAMGAGQGVLNIGSVECLTVTFGKVVLSPVLRQSNLCTYSHAASGLYATLAYHLTGGNLLRWYRDEWGVGPGNTFPKNADVYDLLLAEMPDVPSSVLVLPYFTPSGTPYFDAVTPGAIVGLRLTTPRGDVLRGLLEGLAFEMKLNIALMQEAEISVSEIYCVGGGARSDRWIQLIADVLDQPIRRPHITEAGCRGAAVLACSCASNRQPAEVVGDWKSETQSFTPDPVLTDYYARRFPLYQDLYRRLKDVSV